MCMTAYIYRRSFDKDCLQDAWAMLARPDATFTGLASRKKLYTLLRSPHVHKTARDQFYHREHIGVCRLPNVQASEILQCFSLPGVSCTIRFEEQTGFPTEVPHIIGNK